MNIFGTNLVYFDWGYYRVSDGSYCLRNTTYGKEELFFFRNFFELVCFCKSRKVSPPDIQDSKKYKKFGGFDRKAFYEDFAKAKKRIA